MSETQIRSVSLGKGFGQSNAQTKVTKFHAYTLAPVLVGLPTSSVTLAQIEVLQSGWIVGVCPPETGKVDPRYFPCKS